jgi:hypothetical protein
MTERAKPYVGVSGVGTPETQQQLIELFDEAGLREKRKLMLGVKTLHKCQWLDQPWVRDDGWDLVGEQAFRGAVTKSERTFNIAQAYFDQREVGDQWYRRAFLERMYARGEGWIDGIQFDSYPWHENKDLTAFLHETKDRYPDTQIYLQCHEKSMQRYNPQQIARILGEHAEALDYILFDASHGKGIRLNTTQLAPYIEEAFASDKLAHVGVALAGGLYGPIVREDLPELVSQFPELSWDAEGKLHPVSDDGRMLLNMNVVKDYFDASQEVIG